jgi:hypothetical protein
MDMALVVQFSRSGAQHSSTCNVSGHEDDMKPHIARRGLTAMGICVGMTIGMAQGRSDDAGQRGRSEDAGGPVTVSGCLFEFTDTSTASDSASTSTGSATASSSSQSSLTAARERFVLAKAPPASPPTRYLLVGFLQTDEMRKHVMHQVEVSGTVEPRDSTPADRGPGLRDLRRLNVSSIRTIAQGCTPPRSE